MAAVDTVICKGSYKGQFSRRVRDITVPLYGDPTRRVLNPEPNITGALPQLTFTQYEGDSFGLTAKFSPPKVLHGHNRHEVTDEEMVRVYEIVDNYIYEMTDLIFEADKTDVLRIDYFQDFNVGRENILHYLEAAARATWPGRERWTFEGTVYFGSRPRKRKTRRTRRRKRAHQTKIYDKGAEVLDQSRDGLATDEDVEAAAPLLRVEESVIGKQACRRLARSFGRDEPLVKHLLTQEVSHAVMTATINVLGLSLPIPEVDMRISSLREKYGDGRRFRNLVAFMALMDRFGEGFWERGIAAGYSERAYERDSAALRGAGVWLGTTVPGGLPGLQLTRGS